MRNLIDSETLISQPNLTTTEAKIWKELKRIKLDI
jgi:hypothetical protein